MNSVGQPVSFSLRSYRLLARKIEREREREREGEGERARTMRAESDAECHGELWVLVMI